MIGFLTPYLDAISTGNGAILLVFGWLTIGSIFIIGGWFRQGWRKRIPYSFHNAVLVLALALEFHAAGYALQLQGRIREILFDGKNFATDDAGFWIGTLFILTGKTLFVWVAALGPGRTYSKPYVGAYWASLLAWAIFTAWWMT